MSIQEVVTDPAVLARLPKAHFKVEVKWFWFRRWHPKTPLFFRTRFANALSYDLGPIHVLMPAPWLLGPARSNHPEAFGAHNA